MMAWIALIVAGVFEVVWATAMKQSEGFTRLWPTVVTLVAVTISFGLLLWSMRTLPLGTAYAVWTGIGAVGAFLAGIALFGEAASPARIIAALLILAGLVIMKSATA
ncbi:DMT family transporter [Komagataeibacter swingsii]